MFFERMLREWEKHCAEMPEEMRNSGFGRKKRAIRMLKNILGLGLEILDVNGVNVVHLTKKGEPDIEVIELLAAAGFRDIGLPFESANARIIKKWCSNKWKINNINVEALVREMLKVLRNIDKC